MSIQSNFPALSPSLLLDFASTKQLDSRVTFTRSTPAVYYDGKTTAMAEQNMLLNSVGYSSANGVSVTLSANSSTAPDGTSTAVKLIPGTNNDRHIMYQYTGTGTLGSGQTITASTYVKANGYNYAQLGYFIDGGGCSAGIIVDLTNGTIPTVSGTLIAYSSTSVGSGWYRITISFLASFGSGTGIIVAPSNSGTPSTYSSGSPQFTGDGTSAIYYWGIQMEVRISATAYTATTTQPITNYIPVLLTAGGNQPRFDCNPTTGESLGLLIEEQRTNLLTYSSEFDNAAWTKDGGISVVANQAVAPDGTVSMDQMNRVAGSLNSWAQLTNAFAVGTGGNVGKTYTFSVWVQALPNSGSVNGVLTISDVNYNSYTLGFTATTTPTRVTFTSSGGAGWNASGAYIGGGISLNSNNTSVLVWGAQLEVGAFATSYIATTSASATRTADSASMTGSNFTNWYNQAEGTIYLDYANANVDSGTRLLEIWQGSPFSIPVEIASDGSTWSAKTFNYGAYQVSLSLGSTSASGKLIYSIKTNNFTACANGGTVNSQTSGLLGQATELNIGFTNRSGTDTQINGCIKKLAYYPLRLSNTNLQALTS